MKRLLVIALVAAGGVLAPAASQGAHSVANGQVVFQGKRGAQTAIYVVRFDGSGLHRLTAKGAFSGEPAWSRDGRQIAFVSSRSGEGTLSIYLMEADGSGAKRLSFDPADDHDPSWSPDGRQIAFAGAGISLMFEDGSIVRRITAELPLRSPTWAANGRHIAFASGPNERLSAPEIYAVRSNGVGVQQLTTRRGGAAQPAWSPDGTRIAFIGGSSDLYVMNPDGSHQRRLTYTGVAASAPAWSPNGRFIVFARGKPRQALYVIPSGGGKARLLVSAPGLSLDQPDWQRVP